MCVYVFPEVEREGLSFSFFFLLPLSLSPCPSLPMLTWRIGLDEEDGVAMLPPPPASLVEPATTDSLPPLPAGCCCRLRRVTLRPSTVAERISAPPAPAPPEPPPPPAAGNSLGTKQLRSRNSSTMRLSGGTSSIRRAATGRDAGFSTSLVVDVVARSPAPLRLSRSSISARPSTV